MLFPEVDPTTWSKRYDLGARSGICANCSVAVTFTIPFAHNEFRGLLSDHTECGEEFRQVVFVNKSKIERERLGEFVARFTGDDGEA